MALPLRRLDGTLPSGEHAVAALNDVFSAFPATSATRNALDSALALFLQVVRRQQLGTSVVIDGSYLTSKADPEDIDIALLSTGADETVTLQLLQSEGVNLVLLDIFVSTTQGDFDGWVQFFSADRVGRIRGDIVFTV